jgi:hypothetical protein
MTTTQIPALTILPVTDLKPGHILWGAADADNGLRLFTPLGGVTVDTVGGPGPTGLRKVRDTDGVPFWFDSQQAVVQTDSL